MKINVQYSVKRCYCVCCAGWVTTSTWTRHHSVAPSGTTCSVCLAFNTTTTITDTSVYCWRVTSSPTSNLSLATPKWWRAMTTKAPWRASNTRRRSVNRVNCTTIEHKKYIRSCGVFLRPLTYAKLNEQQDHSKAAPYFKSCLVNFSVADVINCSVACVRVTGTRQPHVAGSENAGRVALRVTCHHRLAEATHINSNFASENAHRYAPFVRRSDIRHICNNNERQNLTETSAQPGLRTLVAWTTRS